MRVTALALPEVLLIEHQTFEDARGGFFEGWNARSFAAAGIEARFVQENVSHSRAQVLRGLHYQLPHAQAKLVRVLAGTIFDVVVDLRRSSRAFGTHAVVTLDARRQQSLWVRGRVRARIPLARRRHAGAVQSDRFLGARGRAHSRVGRRGARDPLAAARGRDAVAVGEGPRGRSLERAECFP